MSNIFKKDDIKAGYLLVVKNTETGEQFNMTVAPTSKYEVPFFLAALLGHKGRIEGELACCCPGDHWWPLHEFDDELMVDEHQVLAVYGYTTPRQLMDNSPEDRELLWEREPAEEATEKNEPETKKMTVAEIAKALGYPVEIVES